MTRNPYVFIVGCPRSGTTLLRRIVGAHPAVAVTPEAHWLTRWFRARRGIDADGRITDALAEAFIARSDSPRFGLDAAEIRRIASRRVAYSEFIETIFEAYGQRRGKQLVAAKTPDDVMEIPLLHELFPYARFVHIIRDGRDVCLSLLDFHRRAKADERERRFPTLAEDPLVTFALLWKNLVSTGRKDGARLGNDYYFEVKYESLVASPKQTCIELCAFLDLEYDEQMLKFHEGRTRTEARGSAARAWLPITPGLRDWSSEMSSADVEVFEAAAAEVLGELGYERAAPQPRPAAHARVSRIEGRWTWDRPRRKPSGSEVR